MANTFPSSGFVGIGTASPNYLLDIPSNNNLYLSNLYLTGCSLNPILSSGGTGGSMCLQGGGAGEGAIRLQGASSNSNGHISFLTNQVEAMRIITGGNVGIGTSSPAAAFHVVCGQNMDNFGTIRYENNSTSTGSTTNAQLLGVTKYGCAQYMVWEDKGMRIGMRSIGAAAGGAGELYFTTCNDTTQMIIKNSGNVGVGTTSPSDFIDAGLGLAVISTSGRTGLALGSTQGTANETLGRLSFTNTNSTNIGSKRLAYISGVRGTSNNSAYLEFGTADDALGAQRMIISQAGSVGINTSSPSYRLHVNGTFYAAGSSQDYKQSICNYNTDSCMFMKLTPVTYQYKDEWCHLGKELKSGNQIGLIAEEVAEVYPELAILVNEDNEKIVRNVDYEKLSIVLLSEVQKLRKELDELKTK